RSPVTASSFCKPPPAASTWFASSGKRSSAKGAGEKEGEGEWKDKCGLKWQSWGCNVSCGFLFGVLAIIMPAQVFVPGQVAEGAAAREEADDLVVAAGQHLVVRLGTHHREAVAPKLALVHRNAILPHHVAVEA